MMTDQTNRRGVGNDKGQAEIVLARWFSDDSDADVLPPAAKVDVLFMACGDVIDHVAAGW
jgi:hypothetical protein